VWSRSAGVPHTRKRVTASENFGSDAHWPTQSAIFHLTRLSTCHADNVAHHVICVTSENFLCQILRSFTQPGSIGTEKEACSGKGRRTRHARGSPSLLSHSPTFPVPLAVYKTPPILRSEEKDVNSPSRRPDRRHPKRLACFMFRFRCRIVELQ
jgi:hypothetical protein